MSEWDEEADGPEPTQEQSDRLELFLRCGWPDVQAGPVSVTRSALGTDDEWGRSAIGYLLAMLSWSGDAGRPAAVSVSTASLFCLLRYVERLEIAAGIIPAPPEPSAGGAS